MQRLQIDPQQWTQLNRLLDEALDLPPDAREQWLDALAPEHSHLKPNLRDLLSRAARVETRDFMSTLPKLEAEAPQAVGGEAPGDTIGPYRLVRELGVGGMGAVWLAERTDGLINRPVALKLPHIASRRIGLAERMAREREILATLTHPNIARLYDAGVSADGRPYLALEYVEGKRIDVYCDEHALDLRARLRLFLQVANAVAYAHAKLIIHRDIKPANILVTGEGEVRLLDFGVAKLLDEGEAKPTKLTELSGRALTLDYASPEQILGDPLTIGTDVYSLGVVFYELLSGARPYQLRRDSRGALEDAIVHVDAPRMSDVAPKSRARALRGDLDTIVLKMLKKRPSERYPTVNALIDDLERHLARRPVLAQPDRAWYRVVRFVSRNKFAVSAVCGVIVALLTGLLAALWQARVALQAKAQADETREFVTSILTDADAYETGRVPTVVEVLTQARRRIDLIDPSRVETRVELLTLVGFSLVGLHETDVADAVLKQAVSEARQLPEGHIVGVRARLHSLEVHQLKGRTQQMRAELMQLTPLIERRADEYPDDLLQLHLSRAHLAIDETKYEEAQQAAQQALKIAKERLSRGDDARAGKAWQVYVEPWQVLAIAYVDGGRPELGLEAAKRAYEEALRVARGEEKHPSVISVRGAYARALSANQQPHAAVAQYERAIADATEVFGPESRSIGTFAQALVKDQLTIGRIADALRNAQLAVELSDKRVQRNSFAFAATINGRARALLEARRGADAYTDFTTAIQTGSEVLGPQHRNVVGVRVNRSQALAYAGRLKEAEGELAALRKLKLSEAHSQQLLRIEALIRRLSNEPEAALQLQRQYVRGLDAEIDQRSLLLANVEIGLSEIEAGRHSEGLASLEAAKAGLDQLRLSATPAYADALIGVGRVMLARDQAAAALPLLEQSDAFWRSFDPETRWAGEAALWLGRCYFALGRKAEAAEALARADKLLSTSPLPLDAQLVKLARARRS